LAKVVGPTEYVRGALAVDDAVASCPIKSRGSVSSGGPSPKQKSVAALGWDGFRRRFSCIYKAPASWKLKSALTPKVVTNRPTVNAEITW
jgi:hypothetical protein